MKLIRSDVRPPEPDGRAPRGPKLNPIDVEAITGLKSGVYADPLEAAKALAPKYRPNVWVSCSKEQRRDIVKDKRKKYANMMARLSPSRA